MKLLPLLAALAATTTSSVLVLAAELEIIVTHAVNCTRKTVAGDSISVHYRGTLPVVDGKEPEVFDSSYGRSPIQFNLGKGNVIAGWDKGLMDMCIGEKRSLVIPPNLAYGSSRAIGSCKSECTLLFDTELITIRGVKSAGDGPANANDGQGGVNHSTLYFLGFLILVAAAAAYLFFQRGRARGKGKGRYEAVPLHRV